MFKPGGAALAVSLLLLLVDVPPAEAQIDPPLVGPEGLVVGALGAGLVAGAAAGCGLRIGPYLGVGAEVGAYAGNDLLLTVSVDGRVGIVTQRHQKLVPLLSGGYSYLKRDYRHRQRDERRRRAGLRTEARDGAATRIQERNQEGGHPLSFKLLVHPDRDHVPVTAAALS